MTVIIEKNEKENVEAQMNATGNNVTEVVFILDRSGSMDHLTDDTIGGFNSLLKKQKEEEGDAIVTTVLFDDQYEVLHNGIDIKKVEEITRKEYFARGCTALLDAVGKTLTDIDRRYNDLPAALVPARTMVVIITDGYENASSEFSNDAIRKMVEQRKERGWEFIFLGANIDSFAAAKSLGISRDRAANFKANARGVGECYEAVGEVMYCFRECKDISEDWGRKLEEE